MCWLSNIPFCEFIGCGDGIALIFA